MNGYNLTRKWYNFKFKNPDLVRSSHSDLYFYIIDLWNRLGQIDKIGLPTSVTMQCLNIGSFNTYKKTLQDLIDFGFIILISDSKNQYTSKIIALSKIDEASDEALDKATIKASDEATDKSPDEATDSIYKQLNNLTIQQLTNEQLTIIVNFFDNLSESELISEIKKIKEKSCAKKEIFNYEEIVEIFNSTCKDLPRVEKITDARKKAINARIKEYSLETIGEVFRKVADSDFLSGRKGDWRTTFDWIFVPANFIKILEDNYKNLSNKDSEKIDFDING